MLARSYQHNCLVVRTESQAACDNTLLLVIQLDTYIRVIHNIALNL